MDSVLGETCTSLDLCSFMLFPFRQSSIYCSLPSRSASSLFAVWPRHQPRVILSDLAILPNLSITTNNDERFQARNPANDRRRHRRRPPPAWCPGEDRSSGFFGRHDDCPRQVPTITITINHHGQLNIFRGRIACIQPAIANPLFSSTCKKSGEPTGAQGLGMV